MRPDSAPPMPSAGFLAALLAQIAAGALLPLLFARTRPSRR